MNNELELKKRIELLEQLVDGLFTELIMQAYPPTLVEAIVEAIAARMRAYYKAKEDLSKNEAGWMLTTTQ